MKKVLFILGTRPEAIKLFSSVRKCLEARSYLTEVCLTNQHTDLIRPFLEEYGIHPDFILPIERVNDSLHQLVASQMQELEKVIAKAAPDLVVVQGDTASAFSGALAAHYLKIPVAHLEAGLRTDSLFSPWPEELHRRLIDQLSSYFFAPTEEAKELLIAEGVQSEAIWVVGNSSIDALCLFEERVTRTPSIGKRSLVVTIHRRENQGGVLEGICAALKTIALSAQDVEIHFFVHPAVRKSVERALGGVNNILLKDPVDHVTFLEYLIHSIFIMSDSGGIQEEAPYLGKPLLILRDSTERPEGVKAGTARLIGTSPHQIVAHSMELLISQAALDEMSFKHYPYGEGDTGEQVASLLEQVLL